MRGPELLKAYAKDVGISLKDVARIVNVSDQTVHQWSAGLTRPKIVMQHALKELADIHWDDWLTEDERDEIKAVRAEINTLRNAPQVKPRTFKDQVSGRI